MMFQESVGECLAPVVIVGTLTVDQVTERTSGFFKTYTSYSQSLFVGRLIPAWSRSFVTIL